MKRADPLYIKSVNLLEEGLNLRAVFTYYIAVITAGLVHIFVVEIHFVSEDGSVHGAKSAESVGGE